MLSEAPKKESINLLIIAIGCGNKQRQRGNALGKNSSVISAVYGYSTCFLPNLQVHNPRKKQPRNELNNS